MIAAKVLLVISVLNLLFLLSEISLNVIGVALN
jgi:hypothetical protein